MHINLQQLDLLTAEKLTQGYTQALQEWPRELAELDGQPGFLTDVTDQNCHVKLLSLCNPEKIQYGHLSFAYALANKLLNNALIAEEACDFLFGMYVWLRVRENNSFLQLLLHASIQYGSFYAISVILDRDGGAVERRDVEKFETALDVALGKTNVMYMLSLLDHPNYHPSQVLIQFAYKLLRLDFFERDFLFERVVAKAKEYRLLNTVDAQKLLDLAVKSANFPAMKVLLDSGMNPYQPDSNNVTPLQRQLRNPLGDLDMTAYMLVVAVSFWPEESRLSQLLTKINSMSFLSGQDSWLILTRILLKRLHLRIGLNQTNGSTFLQAMYQYFSAGKMNALHLAAALGGLDSLRNLLQEYPSAMDAVDFLGRTPLFYATVSGQAEAVGCLLEAGANMALAGQMSISEDKKSPLDIALQQEDRAIVVAFAARRLGVLHRAIECGSLTMIELLLQSGVDPAQEFAGVSAEALAMSQTSKACLHAIMHHPKYSANIASSPVEAVPVYDSLPPVLTEKIQYVGLLGRGTYGSVYKGLRTEGQEQTTVAVKVFHPGLSFSFVQEVWALNKFRSLYVVKLLGIYSQFPAGRFAMEYVEGFTMGDVFYNKIPNYSPAQLKQITLEIALGLQTLHQQHIIHQDLTASNVLLNPRGQTKICDFGFAHTEAVALRVRMGGAPAFMPPEVYSFDKPFTTRIDIFSLGVIIWVMLRCRVPWGGVGVSDIKRGLMAGNRLAFASVFSPATQKLQDIAGECWRTDPIARPNATEIIEQLRLVA